MQGRSDVESSLTLPSSTTLGKRPRYHLCSQCHSEYDVVTNHKEACMWHPDELMEDEEGILGNSFADRDYETHGTVDTEENKRAYPQYFIFPCCENSGRHEGCMTGHHDCEGDETPGKKKTRVETGSELGSEESEEEVEEDLEDET